MIQFEGCNWSWNASLTSPSVKTFKTLQKNICRQMYWTLKNYTTLNLDQLFGLQFANVSELKFYVYNYLPPNSRFCPYNLCFCTMFAPPRMWRENLKQVYSRSAVKAAVSWVAHAREWFSDRSRFVLAAMTKIIIFRIHFSHQQQK